MSEKRNRLLSWFGSLIILSVAFPTSVFPQNSNQKIKELEQMITQLEKRIAKLEGVILELQKNLEKPIIGSSNKWKDKANWRILRNGMRKDEVKRILGEPPTIVANTHYGDIWYYPDPKGGNVSFSTEGLLTSWDEI